MTANPPCPRFAESLPLLTLGLLPETQARACRDHLAVCLRCRRALEDYDLVSLHLATHEIARRPPPELKERVLARLPGSDASSPFVTIKSAAATGWEKTDVPGIHCRRLQSAAEDGREVALYRMEPGTCYPAHRHVLTEDCWILEGDLQVGDTTLHVGDFQRAPAGSVHPPQSTENGCLVLVVGSTNDERL